jgi:RNA ligase
MEKYRKLEKDGLVTIRKHPLADLFIINYTAKVQYERLWTEELKQCRGLIVNSSGMIIQRSFPKFFNMEELDDSEIPKESYLMHEKMDGSLGILYWLNDLPHIASRGSFESDQAKEVIS